MNAVTNPGACGRSDDLISFLYGELGEREARSFEHHLRECSNCRIELTGFGFVRESMIAWRDQALGAMPVDSFRAEVRQPEQRRSALAAIRGFFDLSPLWMKAAAAFAVLMFFVLAGVTLTQLFENRNPPTTLAEKVYTQKEFAEAVNKEVESRMAQLHVDQKRDQAVANVRSIPVKVIKKKEPVNTQLELAGFNQEPRRLRKPLSRAERNQLAADLRLISGDDDDSLHFLGDRINRER